MGGKDNALYAVLKRSLKIGPKQVKNKEGKPVDTKNKILTGSWESTGWFFGSGGKDGKSASVVKIETNFNNLVKQFNETTLDAVLEVPEELRADMPEDLKVIRNAIDKLANTEVNNNDEERNAFLDEIAKVQVLVNELESRASSAKKVGEKRIEQQITYSLPQKLPFKLSLTSLNAKTKPTTEKGGGILELFDEDDEPFTEMEFNELGEFKFAIRASGTLTCKEKEVPLTINPQKGTSIIEWKLPPEIPINQHVRLKLLGAKAKAGDGELKLVEPPDGKFTAAGEKTVKVELSETPTFKGCTVTGKTKVIPAEQEIEWNPPPITYPNAFTDEQRNAKIKRGIKGELEPSAYTFPEPEVGKVTLTLVVPGNVNWLETTVEADVVVLPPEPPQFAVNKTKDCEQAKISQTMQGKIVDGQEKPSEKGKVRGGHSANILKDKKKYKAEVLELNQDGTASVKFRMHLGEDEKGKKIWSDLKESTVAPDNWNSVAILAATVQVGKAPATYTRSDGYTLHTAIVNGVQWDVIKDGDGEVKASYPTGGKLTSEKAFKKNK